VGAGDGGWLMFRQPGQHREGPGGVDAVEAGADDFGAGCFVQSRGLGGGALVAPHDGGAQEGAGGVRQDRDMGAGGEADAGDGGGANAGRCEGGGDGGAERVEPFLRVLLGPAGVRDVRGDGLRGFARDVPGIGDDGGLQAAGAEVYPHQVLFHGWPFRLLGLAFAL